MALSRGIKATEVFLISYSALMTTLVFISTVVISVYIQATAGFFNIGEFGVYLAALTGGPIVGAIAGGIGSALADIYLGYTHYAPISLVVKGLEGFIVGLLVQRLRRTRISRPLGMILVGGSSLMITLIGVQFYVGSAELSLLGSIYMVEFSYIVWPLVSLLLLGWGLYLYLRKPERAVEIAAILVGGMVMVIGYFTAQYTILGYGPGAYVEMPFNIMQVLIGMTLALPIYERIGRVIETP